MSKKLYEESNIQDIANAIREKNGTTNTYKPSEMGGAIREINGPNWINYARSLNRMFQYAIFPDGTELSIYLPNLNVDLDSNQNIRYAFMGCVGIKSVKLKCDNIGKTYANQCFTNNKTLEIIDFSEFPVAFGGCSQMFNSCNSLKEIKGVLELIDDSMDYMFGSCNELEEVRFKEGCISNNISFSGKKLSEMSVQSIINGLADLADGTTKKIVFNSYVVEKLTEEQVAQITTKNWNIG